MSEQMNEVDQKCCDLHRGAGCCDPNDCGPCCEWCPTCPTVRQMARLGEDCRAPWARADKARTELPAVPRRCVKERPCATHATVRRCDHEWGERGGPGDQWRECWLCGTTRDASTAPETSTP